MISDVREHFEETLACFRRHLALRIQTESCCRRCKEPDWGRCGSSGCRSSYRRSGREEHGVDGCEANRQKKLNSPAHSSQAAVELQHVKDPLTRLPAAMAVAGGEALIKYKKLWKKRQLEKLNFPVCVPEGASLCILSTEAYMDPVF